jgi:hypothetical protein
MYNRDEWLKLILWLLWRNAQFEADFQRDWFAVYQIFEENDLYRLDDIVLEMVIEYTKDWIREESDKLIIKAKASLMAEIEEG